MPGSCEGIISDMCVLNTALNHSLCHLLIIKIIVINNFDWDGCRVFVQITSQVMWNVNKKMR